MSHLPLSVPGFGIRLVKAMASGCAEALMRNVCWIPEVVGDATHLFEPRKPDSIADALEQMTFTA
jgi:glycosyltransferase involved in cell wall biosynthesis